MRFERRWVRAEPRSCRASARRDAAWFRAARSVFTLMVAGALLALAACSTEPGAPPATAEAQQPSDVASPQAAGPTTAKPSSDHGVAATQAKRGSPGAGAQAPPNVDPDMTPATDRTPEARLDGLGPLRLGMTTQEAVRAWPSLYADRPQRIDARGCDYAQVPGGALPYVALKFDDGRFVRYGGSSDALAAPGGGRRGLSAQALQERYANALRREPDPERPRGRGYRVVHDTHGVAPTRLAFVIDGEDRVIEWYVGLSQGRDHSLACPS